MVLGHVVRPTLHYTVGIFTLVPAPIRDYWYPLPDRKCLNVPSNVVNYVFFDELLRHAPGIKLFNES